MVIRGTVPLCMKQYERIFSTNRIPGKVRWNWKVPFPY